MKSLLNNNVLVSVRRELAKEVVSVDARTVVNGAKFNTVKEVKKANAVISDVIEAMCGEVLAMEEAMEKAVADKKVKVAKRNVKIAKAVRVPVNKKEAGIVTPKIEKHSNACVSTRLEKFLSSCNNVVKYFDLQRSMMKKSCVRTNLQLLASGSASTSTNNNNNTPNGSANGSASVGINNIPNGGLNMNNNTKTNNTVGGGQTTTCAWPINPEFYNLTGMTDREVKAIFGYKGSDLLVKPMGKMVGVEIVVEDKKKKTVGITSFITSLPYNGYTKGLEFNDSVVTVGGNTYTFTEEDRFSDAFFAMTLDSMTSQSYAADTIYADFTKGVIAIPNHNGQYINVSTGRILKNLSKLNAYKLSLMTASGLRADSKQQYTAVYHKIEEGKNVADLLNECCYDVVALAKKDMTKDQAAKFVTRSGLRWTASKAIGKLGAVAYYDGVFDADKNENTFDGVGFITDELASKLFNCTKRQAREVLSQSRPGGVIKIQLRVISERMMAYMIDMYKQEGKITVHGNGTPHFLFDSNCIKANINLTDIDLDVLAFGKTTQGSMSKQLLSKVYLEAALMDKENKNTKMTDAVNEFVFGLGAEAIQSIIEEIVAPSMDSANSSYLIDVINGLGKMSIPAAKKSSLESAAKRIAKLIDKLKFSDGNMQYNVIYTDSARLFGHNIINVGEIYLPTKRKVKERGVAIKFPSVGAKEYISFETLPFVEIKARVKSLNCSDELKEILIDDYALMSSANIVLPANRKTFDSCAGLDIDMDTIETIFSKVIVDVLWGKEEFVKLDAKTKLNGKVKADKSVLAKKAKADFMARLSKKANEGDDVAEALLNREIYNPENDDFAAKMFQSASTGSNKSIGSITYDNDNMGSVVIEAVKGNHAPIMQLLTENFGKLNGTNVNYVGLPLEEDTRLLSEVTIDEMVKEIKNTKLTHENLVLIALDLQRCERLYQETAIDAAKTGIEVNIAVACASILTKSLVKVEFSYVVNEITGERSFTIKRKEREMKEVTRKHNEIEYVLTPMLIEDEMSKVQDQLIEYAMELLTDVVDELGVLEFNGVDSEGNVVSSTDMASKLNKVVTYYATKEPERHNAILTIRKIYAQLAKEYSNTMNMLDVKEASDDEKEMARTHFELKLSYLSNSFETLISKLKEKTEQATMMTRGLYLVGVGALELSKSIINNKSANKFAFNIASHYTLAYAMQDNKYTTNCKVLFHDGITEGEVEVTRGFADDRSIVVRDNFSGRAQRKAIIDVKMDDEGNVTASETVNIERPEHDNNKAVMVINTKLETILDDNNMPVLDTNGVIKTNVTGNADKIIKVMQFGGGNIKVTKDGVELSYVLNGETRTTLIPKSEVNFTDAIANSNYGFNSAYKVRVGQGALIVELNRK